MAAFNTRLRQLRHEAGISQNDLAKQIGVSKSSVNMYERGEREPGFETLEAIADFFNVDMNYLLGASPSRGDGRSAYHYGWRPDEDGVNTEIVKKVATTFYDDLRPEDIDPEEIRALIVATVDCRGKGVDISSFSPAIQKYYKALSAFTRLISSLDDTEFLAIMDYMDHIHAKKNGSGGDVAGGEGLRN